MNYSSIPSAHTVIHHCKARGIKQIVISPGSRNAPLTLGFTGDPFFTCYSIVDERCASFFALGMAQQLRECVAVVCTSGSALLNYYPAVAEAFYSDIPLLVISADRPAYLIDRGDGQTIRQDHVFERHILYTALLKQDVQHAMEAIRAAGQELPSDAARLAEWQQAVQAHNDSELNKAIELAVTKRGPVHVNVPLEEPLYGIRATPPLLPDVSMRNPPILPFPQDLRPFAELWNKAERKIVLIGSGHPGFVDTSYLAALAADPSVLVFTETTSNCHHPDFFPGIDSIIAPIEKSQERELRFRELQPELLLTLGGMIVSKKIKAFLRRYRPLHHWHIDEKTGYDTYFSLSRHFKTTPDQFLRPFLPLIQPKKESAYYRKWAAARERYRKRREEYLSNIPFTDMLAFHHVLGHIPEQYQVQLANSSTIRYAQLFEPHPGLKVFCNRGTSGIDGSVSTAVGASVHEVYPTLLITGDLSLLYDSNGLWNNYLRADFRIIVINNQGGGIFRILPGRQDTTAFETFFETVQDLDLSKLCELYHLEHEVAGTEKELLEALATFYKPSGNPKLLEIRTPRLLNNNILLAYFDFLS